MSERCLKVWENVWDGLKDLRSGERRLVLESIFAYAFDGAEPKLSGSAAGVFKIVRPLLAVYDSGKAFSGSLGGAVGGSAKSAAMLGNSNASKTQAKRKQDASKTQAKRKQNGSKTQALQNENENGNIPPLSPKGGEGSSVGRFQAPISREQCVNLAADPIMSVQVPAEFAASWWDEHEHDGWTDDEGRAIKGMRRVRQLLAGAFKYEKNKSARAVEPVGGSARVFDPEVCE